MKFWNTKTILRASLIAAIAGIVLAAAGFALGAEYKGLYWDHGPRIISRADIMAEEHSIPNVRNIRIDALFSDIEFVTADRYGIALTGIRDEWEWNVNGDSLEIIQQSRQQNGFHLFGAFAVTARKVIVYLPQNAELGNVNIHTDSGDISLGSFQAESTLVESGFGSASLRCITSDILEIDMDSGDLDCSDTTTGSLTSNGNFGSGTFDHVTANSFSVTFDSGDLTCIDSALGQTDVQLNFGSFNGQAVSTNGLTMDVDSGDIEISGEILGETVITANFGSVNLKPASPAAEYAYDLETDFGDVDVNNEDMGTRALNTNTNAPNSISVYCDSGDIEVLFDK